MGVLSRILVMLGVIRQAEFVAFLKVGPPEVFPGCVFVFGLMHSVGADVALGLPPPAYNALFEAQVYMLLKSQVHRKCKITSTREKKSQVHIRKPQGSSQPWLQSNEHSAVSARGCRFQWMSLTRGTLPSSVKMFMSKSS